MGKLSTHVLDTARGCPAAGVGYLLYRVERVDDAEKHMELASGVTNADGRTDQPLLAGEGFAAGVLELRFNVGAYLQTHAPDEPAFFDWVTIRFVVSDASANYHVPLLLSPWSYTTYRGS